MEEITKEEQVSTTEKIKVWAQDNLRILISIAIVVAIAGGIYSYSQRTASPIVEEQDEIAKNDDSSSSVETEQKQATTEDQKVTEEQAGSETAKATTSASSKETDGAFVETAGKGDGLTHLSRRALANYLEKNPDSALTKEHKIYIEDYLRKAVGQKGGVKVGTSVEFSKDLVSKAIEQSKNLNENQLKNLQKYSARVSSL